MQVFQHTIKRSVQFSGIGLHTGKKVNVRIEPAKENTGIVFVRSDVVGSPSIKVSPEYLSKLFYATTLSNGKVSVQTVEHLLAALSAFGIDNLYVILDSEELPILDGSSAPYLYILEEAEREKQSAKKKYLKLKRTVKVETEGKKIFAEPHSSLEIENIISFDHTYKKVRYQRIKYTHTLENFRKISVARTFCFYHEVEALRSAGLAKGGSLENAIVIGDYDVLNKEGLRLENEFVAHKTLDLVGDLYILGYQILAKISAYRTGHALNASFVKTVYYHKLYEVVELEPSLELPQLSFLPNSSVAES